MSQERLVKILQKARKSLGSIPSHNEQAVRQGIINPILEGLGWDTSDVLEVHPEYSLEGQKADYALCIKKGRASSLRQSLSGKPKGRISNFLNMFTKRVLFSRF